jgi:hypothetical protein
MTRRAHSFKRNNTQSGATNNAAVSGGALSTHNEVELQINSPRSEEGLESASDRKHGHHIHNHHLHHVSQRAHGGIVKGFLKRPLESIAVDLGFREKRKIGHWMFLVFCGVCLFMGVLKICATGWLGSAIEKAQSYQVFLFSIIILS